MTFFSSPTSNILPSTFAPASVAMSRSDSRDSATSTTSSTRNASWDIRPRSSSSSAETFSTLLPSHSHSHTSHRRTSSSSSTSSSSAANWTPSPYRSCLSQVEDYSSSSYISDDDLLDLPALEIDLIESPAQKELSTEEQIEMLRAYREREAAQHYHHGHASAMQSALQQTVKPEMWQRHPQHHQQQHQQPPQKKSRVVRFAAEQPARSSSGRRRQSSTLRRC